jgi:protein-disulfide isomerase
MAFSKRWKNWLPDGGSLMAVLKVPVNASDHVQGRDDAPLTLLEYGDYECPYCGLAYPIIKDVQSYFGERLRFVFRNFPLTQVHPNAESAAETAEFAAVHGRFWEMHDGLFENQQYLGLKLYVTLASRLALPIRDLRVALAAGIYASRVRSDFLSGVRSGVNGTPTFFINSMRHDGTPEFDDLVRALETEYLRQAA